MLNTAVCGSMLYRIIKYGSMRHRIVEYGSMRHLSRYHTLHVVVRGMRIWPPNAAKCCKNAGKFFPDVVVEALSCLLRFSYKNIASTLIKLESPISFLT
jgi:hypothetical protein